VGIPERYRGGGIGILERYRGEAIERGDREEGIGKMVSGFPKRDQREVIGGSGR
jgi:hypothetical protein